MLRPTLVIQNGFFPLGFDFSFLSPKAFYGTYVELFTLMINLEIQLHFYLIQWVRNPEHVAMMRKEYRGKTVTRRASENNYSWF